MEPLKGLDNIDWQNLRHAYGPAADVPQNIRALLSTDQAIWEEAFDNLMNTIWHQGTVYSATAYTIPFLVELLQYDFVINKEWLLFGLLPTLANGRSYFDVHYHLDPLLSDKILADMGTDFPTQLQKELGYVKSARQAVLNHVDVYEKLLDHKDPKILTGAIYLLGELPEHSRISFPRFQALYAEDERVEIRNSILHAIRKLDVPAPLKNEFFEPIYDQESNHLLKNIAALGAFEAQATHYRCDIFNHLVKFCRELEETTKLGWLDGDSWGGPSIGIYYVVEACLELSSVSNVQEIRQVALSLQKPDEVFGIIEKLLTKLYGSDILQPSIWSWENGRRVILYYERPLAHNKPIYLATMPSYIPTKYKIVVDLTLELDRFWDVKSNLLNLIGLPHSRAELMALREVSN